jgi:hypothetical protein
MSRCEGLGTTSGRKPGGHIAFVKGVAHVWDGCAVPLHACVIRYWNRKKKALDHIVLGTTDQGRKSPWMVRHYEERPEN